MFRIQIIDYFRCVKVLWLVIGVCGGFWGHMALTANPSPNEETPYVCPPCSCEGDGLTHEAPGACEYCGMALVKKGSQMSEVPRVRPASRPMVGILVFPGVQIIDYTGPFEVFGQGGFEAFTVWENEQPLTTNMGMKIIPNYDFKSCPDLDVLVVPGGGVDSVLNHEKAVAWVKEKAQATDHVLTVCNGAFILAKTGLLDGLRATTFYGLIDSLKAFAPKVEVVSDQRYVDNGKFITTAGLSSGIDGSLHVISKIHGPAVAQKAALNMEYDWKPGSDYARADFADTILRGSIISRGFYPLMEAEETRWQVVQTQGDSDHWNMRWHVATDLEPAALHEKLGKKLSHDGGWQKEEASTSSGESHWRFTDDQGRAWRGFTCVEPAAKDQSGLAVSLKIELAKR